MRALDLSKQLLYYKLSFEKFITTKIQEHCIIRLMQLKKLSINLKIYIYKKFSFWMFFIDHIIRYMLNKTKSYECKFRFILTALFYILRTDI